MKDLSEVEEQSVEIPVEARPGQDGFHSILAAEVGEVLEETGDGAVLCVRPFVQQPVK